MSYWNGSSYVSYTTSSWEGVNKVGDDIISWNSTNGYKSNSSWDNDLEWAILAACSQFKESSLRKEWGRTLIQLTNYFPVTLSFAKSLGVVIKEGL